MDDIDCIDPANEVVKLCARGMAAEAEGCAQRARELFDEAWSVSSDDYEACIAAHYVARHQSTVEETLWWNQEALRRADAADRRSGAFYPSLHLNVADALEQLGRMTEAYQQYTLAAARLERLPASGYMDLVRMAVTQGQARTRAGQPQTYLSKADA